MWLRADLEGEEGVSVFHGQTCQPVCEEDKIISLCFFVSDVERGRRSATLTQPHMPQYIPDDCVHGLDLWLERQEVY
jgi:hypothetical protein